MKQLVVPRLHCEAASADAIPALLDRGQVAWNAIDEVDWADEYPYCPRVGFRISHAGRCIMLHYRVAEQSVAAVAAADNGNVWEDSCVEFFFMPDGGDGIYYNIECNCAGRILVGAGRDRHDRELAPPELLAGVTRWASLGSEPFAERVGETAWEVVLSIPLDTFFKHSLVSLSGSRVGANFFKCGDRLRQPHFVSWNRVEAPSPDFHRPECFGSLLFE